jgi:hypothetical protein
MRLTLRNIGHRQKVFSCIISYLYANAMQPTNQGVGSSNLSGRANIFKYFRDLWRCVRVCCYRYATKCGKEQSRGLLATACNRTWSRVCVLIHGKRNAVMTKQYLDRLRVLARLNQ